MGRQIPGFSADQPVVIEGIANQVRLWGLMTEFASRHSSSLVGMSGQPIAIGAVALAIVLLGMGSITLWRGYAGTAPKTDHVVATRQLQARAAQASQQLVEKTRGLEATQQESIDQLQVMQDQLQTVRRQLAAQQAETRKLSEQVTTLTESIDGLRQSFASARAAEPAAPSTTRKQSARRSGKVRSHGVRHAKRKPHS